MSSSIIHHPSSYRDPSGFMFSHTDKSGNKKWYRQVNQVYKEDLDLLLSSGLYEKLAQKKLLIPHKQIDENLSGDKDWYATLEPEQIDFLSYPWEWSFDMLKDAALLTLQITRDAISSGMILKDATPFNIQWHQGRLIFIDTLSFEKYDPDKPWIAYRQFCESFLAPLLLMHYRKIPLQQLSRSWPEGIPLAVAKTLLPWRSKLSLHSYLHIHLHASVASKQKSNKASAGKFSKQKMLNLISSLELLVGKLSFAAQRSAWSEYYDEASQRKNYLEEKKKIINGWLANLNEVRTASDLGANDGEFSHLLTAKGIRTIAADIDPYCINRLYLEIKKSGEKYLQPMIVDLADPSPAIGFNNEERASLVARLDTDLCMALALIHHLAIGKNISLAMIAEFMNRITHHLIIEFVPKTDEKVIYMLAGKKDIYHNYSQEEFEKQFAGFFKIEKKEPIGNSGRILYLMKRNAE